MTPDLAGMRTICITVDDPSYGRVHPVEHQVRPDETREHFKSRGVDAQFFRGIHAPRLGIDTTLPYDLNGVREEMGPASTGTWLSHRALWAACMIMPHDTRGSFQPDSDLFLLLEDDAMFPEDWACRTHRALQDAGDFDVLLIGSCCTSGKPSKHVAGEVYDVDGPLCAHAYIVRRRALAVLIEACDEARCYGPIDITLALHAYPKLRVLTVLPRIVDQVGLPGLAP
jgi:GR25 family glycosyltransferase involved in LPS biosynthesis